ncbi:armadillo repeat-containing protein 3 isoform X2 [Lingula anatina]|uniref:Armadillo repeat-containing protein 3 isoform X2 n=1 Tax=Lingula anatina TaxID=7574 RepID=A0A1S3H948_LINAN|nr:armadillo repeat-containing protein 3 isoform X2 [Lingula anatina]|eukprot:XP_013381649.1 armadillo repeat-containing protein 3 isoform X2 [Lingula anatina]
MGKKVKKEEKTAPDDVFDTLLVESRQAATVVLMLDSPEEEVQSKACEAIYKFVDKCDENKKVLMDLGAVEKMLKLMQSEDRIVRRNALMAFGVMSAHPDVRKLLRKQEECIPTVVSLLNPEEDTVCHEFAAMCLSYLSNDFSSKVAIFEQNGLEPLIRCLSASDPDVQKNAIESIAHMLQDYQARTAINELNGLPSIIDLLKSEYTVIQELALISLERAAQDPENRATMREIEALDTLIKFIGTPEYSDLHVYAVQVLSNCLDDIESMEQIKESGGLQKLVAFITDVAPPEDEPKAKGGKGEKGGGSRKGKKGKDDDDESKHKGKGGNEGDIVPTLPDVKQFAAKAIARAAKNAENRKVLHEQEVEKMLIILLGHEEPHVQVAACQALATMAENLTCRDAIREWEGIEPLVKLLKSDNGEVREAVTLALANLTTANSNNCNEVINFGGIEPLIGMLGDPKEGVVANAAVVLTNMSLDEVMRVNIQAQGVIYALIDPLRSSNPSVQSKTALGVAAFVCDADTRAEFRNAGGLEPLVAMLNSGNAEVRRSASWAITVCAVDEPTAMEIARLGGLDILQTIQQSGSRKNCFTDVALDRLLDSNLSAKYALTGLLGTGNLITDGFFDPGQLRPGTKLGSLEDYCKMEVDQRRPVLLISFRTDGPTTPMPSDVDVRQDGSNKAALAAKQSKSVKDASRVARTKSQRDRDDKSREEEAVNRDGEQGQEESTFIHPPDSNFAKYMEEVQEKVQPLNTTKEQVVALAQYVADKMGGAIERGQLANFSYELPISQIKFDLKSNVIPIGMIKTGIHYHRALLFKALADSVAVPCTLQRGEYNRAWNEVWITDDDGAPGAPKFPPKAYIVDLIHHPGDLMRSDSAEAVQYQRL